MEHTTRRRQRRGGKRNRSTFSIKSHQPSSATLQGRPNTPKSTKVSPKAPPPSPEAKMEDLKFHTYPCPIQGCRSKITTNIPVGIVFIYRACLEICPECELKFGYRFVSRDGTFPSIVITTPRSNNKNHP